MDDRRVTKCRGCFGPNLKPWFSLGSQPLANNLVSEHDLENPMTTPDEKFFPLSLLVCDHCQLVQLSHVVNPDLLFKNYLYYSSTSAVFRQHFESLAANEFAQDRIKQDDLVVDIGSNDGILLKPFKDRGARVLGIEPAGEIANAAVKDGIETIAEYFTGKTANDILENYGEAKLVTATNVFAHVDDLDEIVDAVKMILADDGRFMIEVAYLPEMIKKGSFDLIYHEHLCYWHLSPLETFLARKGMYIDEVKRIDVHGGSIRVFAKVGGSNLGSVLKGLKDYDLTTSKEFWNFPKKVEKNKKDILALLAKLKKNKNVDIVGYGAPAKMSTMTNYFDIGPDTLNCILEDAPAKWGLYSPGQHIKIVKYDPALVHGYSDFIFIFAWNFAESIMKKCLADGFHGKFIIPFPNVKLV